MDATDIALLWIRALEREVRNNVPDPDVWLTVRSKLNTERITAHGGMSMGHLPHNRQLEVQRAAKDLVDRMSSQFAGFGIRTG